MPVQVRPFSELSDVLLIESKLFRDDRGWFAETYKESEFRAAGLPTHFVQDNQSHSVRKGTLRGLHYQLNPSAQGKLVRCSRGRVFDVAVDIRRQSPTFGKWVSTELTADNGRAIWVPPGFAHGVQTLEDDTTVSYKVTSEYSGPHDRSIRWDDPAIGVRWPLPHPILSPKDAGAPLLQDADNTF